jgi:hypothetical protein
MDLTKPTRKMVRLRLAAMLGLLALVPVGAYFVTRGELVSLVLSAVSVLLVVGSLWLMVGDAEEPGATAEQ